MWYFFGCCAFLIAAILFCRHFTLHPFAWPLPLSFYLLLKFFFLASTKPPSSTQPTHPALGLGLGLGFSVVRGVMQPPLGHTRRLRLRLRRLFASVQLTTKRPQFAIGTAR